MVGPNATTGPELAVDPNGADWLVTQVSGSAAKTRFWQAVTDPATYGP